MPFQQKRFAHRPMYFRDPHTKAHNFQGAVLA